MAKIVKINGFEIKVSKKDIQEKVDVINNALENNENLQHALHHIIFGNDVVLCGLFNKVFYYETQFTFKPYGDRYVVTRIALNNKRTIFQMVQALIGICDELITTYNDLESVDMIINGYRPDWYIKMCKKEKAIENTDELNSTFNQTHAKYRTTINQVLLLDLIYLALHELETITIASGWVGTNEFDLMPDDLEKREYIVVWFNFWLRCFIKDFLKVCKIQVGLLNRKLNKEIKQNECLTSYAEYLFYLKNKVKQDYYRLNEA